LPASLLKPTEQVFFFQSAICSEALARKGVIGMEQAVLMTDYVTEERSVSIDTLNIL
jgi:hypothetical protein